MKTLQSTIVILFLLLGVAGCKTEMYPYTDSNEISLDTETKKVLMLTVDYTTNKFMGGKELEFSQNSETFTITNEYKEPCDLGYLKLYYEELDELLFFGTITWMGLGKMQYPQDLLEANQFKAVNMKDYWLPKNGFENIFPVTYYNEFDSKAWSAVQKLVKTREYLYLNPEQAVKVFLYTPSVGMGNPKDWYWIIYLKK